jgi:hypothetical protein
MATNRLSFPDQRAFDQPALFAETEVYKNGVGLCQTVYLVQFILSCILILNR